MERRKGLMVLLIICVLPFVAGCFGKGNKNPIADTSLPSIEANSATASVDSLEDPKILACRFSAPTLKKYTYAQPGHQIVKRLRSGLAKPPGFLRLAVQAAESAEHIYITIKEIKVKKEDGTTIRLPIEKEVDLLNAATISEVLGDVNLSPGFYKNLSFKIVSGRVVKNGRSSNLFIPSQKVNFVGKFEIKEGYRTELIIRFIHKLIKIWIPGRGDTYIFNPAVKISYKLVEITTIPPQITDGDIFGVVQNFVTKAPLSGINVALKGTNFSAQTNDQGRFSITGIPKGTYVVELSHPDYLDKSFEVQIEAGQVAEVTAEMNPAVIRSTVANTGWFSYEFPWADAHGDFAETFVETPLVIDFASMNFKKVEVTFDAEYFLQTGEQTRFLAYISGTKQVQVLQDLGSWWVGNNGTFGQLLGEFYNGYPPVRYVLDVTEYVRNNPNAMYFLAFRSLYSVNMRVLNIQMSIYYR